MDLKYLLCEPVSKLSVQASHIGLPRQPKTIVDLEWPSKPIYHAMSTGEQEWHQDQPTIIISSPKSVCSSISACSSTSSTSSQDEINHVTYKAKGPDGLYEQPLYQSRRRTASDVSLTRHHMFIYSHPNRRPRSKSAGNSDSNHHVQTRTPWTPFEDHLLRQGYDQGLSWAMISSTYLPHRSRGCCWGRFKTLQNKNMVDPSHSQMRHFRRPWKAIDFSNQLNSKKSGL